MKRILKSKTGKGENFWHGEHFSSGKTQARTWCTCWNSRACRRYHIIQFDRRKTYTPTQSAHSQTFVSAVNCSENLCPSVFGPRSFRVHRESHVENQSPTEPVCRTKFARSCLRSPTLPAFDRSTLEFSFFLGGGGSLHTCRSSLIVLALIVCVCKTILNNVHHVYKYII